MNDPLPDIAAAELAPECAREEVPAVPASRDVGAALRVELAGLIDRDLLARFPDAGERGRALCATVGELSASLAHLTKMLRPCCDPAVPALLLGGIERAGPKEGQQCRSIGFDPGLAEVFFVGGDFFFVGARAVVLAERRLGDARQFLVDAAASLRYLSGGGDDLRMTRSED